MKRRKKNQTPKEDVQLDTRAISSDLDGNLAFIKDTLGNGSDLVTRRMILNKKAKISGAVIFIDGLVDKNTVQDFILEVVMVEVPPEDLSISPIYEAIKDSTLPIGEIYELKKMDELILRLLSGETIVMLDNETRAIAASTKGWKDRGVQETTSESVIRGPKEAFTETLRTNTAMVRRKIKDPKLRIDAKKVGKMTVTDVSVIYIQDTADESVVKEVHARLDNIDIDGVLESGYLEEFIEDPPYSPFPKVYYTERPDAIAAGLLEGKVAIITDGTPNVLLVPALFVNFMQSSEDYYQRYDIGTFIRLLRLFAFCIALFMPSLYIAITTFHQEMIPAPLLINLAAQREGVPFPAFVEAVLMEATFEILREAGVRLPKAVGSAVSIVGALVLGESAVQAGLVSPAMVIVVAITAISSFVFPSYNMAIPVRMLRFSLMILAATFGLYGIILGLIALVLHLCSLQSFGVPYMSPLAPLVPKDQKDVLVRFPHWGLLSRPSSSSHQNEKRTSGRKEKGK
ncbi:spore germination protein [Thalassobacillus devorans]|uniref:Spore germination protein n=1 Tax=Thalassobacillus devorans TaxID=279813 RepID=A0ABQ1NHS5_9BACI|nr:spore germination protein [Thalassobacillus devorans]NIK26920.1 spore germination protein KA [Thalassobacillus devorans]GGC73463.1 spore germination protein [Thalassobacillus devorans]